MQDTMSLNPPFRFLDDRRYQYHKVETMTNRMPKALCHARGWLSLIGLCVTQHQASMQWPYFDSIYHDRKQERHCQWAILFWLLPCGKI